MDFFQDSRIGVKGLNLRPYVKAPSVVHTNMKLKVADRTADYLMFLNEQLDIIKSKIHATTNNDIADVNEFSDEDEETFHDVMSKLLKHFYKQK